MVIRELLTRLGFVVDKTGEAKYNAAVGRMRASAVRLQETLRGASGFLFMGFVAQQLGKKLLETADQGLQLQNRLNGLKAASGKGVAGLGELLQMANKTYVPVEQATEVYSRMYTALAPRGESIENIKLFTQNLLTMLKAGGASQEEMSSAITQLGQSLNNGKLQGDELNSILDASPMLINNIAKALSKKYKLSVQQAREQIKKFGENGQITLDVLTAALADTGDAAAVMGAHTVTLAESMTVLRNNIAFAAFKSDTLKIAITTLAKAAMWLSDHVEYVYGAFAAFGLLLGGSLLLWVVRVTAALWAMAASAAGAAIAMFAALAPFILIGAAIALVVLAIQDFYTWLNGGDSVFGRWVEIARGHFSEVGPLFVDLLNFMSDRMHDFTTWIYNLLPQSFQNAFDAVKPIFENFVTWAAQKLSLITAPLNWLSDKMHSAVGAIGNAIQTAPVDSGVARARGGPVQAGRRYIVGEHGAEGFIPGRSGTIIPNSALSMLNSGFSGQSRRGDVNVNIDLGGVTVNGGGTREDAAKNGQLAGNEIAKVIREELRKTFVSTMANFPSTA